MRTRVPDHYQSTVADYFDLMIPGPHRQRRLAFGEPEPSDCGLYGSGGYHLGWMVPVIYDTTPAAAAAGRGRGGPARTSPVGRSRTSSSGTAPARTPDAPVVATVSDGVATATLEEVKVSGKGYFFWFSSDTIAAVTRRPDRCPP